MEGLNKLSENEGGVDFPIGLLANGAEFLLWGDGIRIHDLRGRKLS